LELMALTFFRLTFAALGFVDFTLTCLIFTDLDLVVFAFAFKALAFAVMLLPPCVASFHQLIGSW